MNQEVASLLLLLIVVGGSAALSILSKSTTNLHKRSVKLKCPDCGHVLVVTVEDLHA